MEQLPDSRQGIIRTDEFPGMHSTIAKVFDDPNFGVYSRPDSTLKGGFVNQCTQIVLIRKPQTAIVLVEPTHGQLKGAPGVEARGASIWMDQRFGLRCRLEDLGPFALEKAEVAHPFIPWQLWIPEN